MNENTDDKNVNIDKESKDDCTNKELKVEDLEDVVGGCFTSLPVFP